MANVYKINRGYNIEGDDPNRTTPDEQLFNTLLRRGDYNQAANYLNQFKFYDPIEQDKHKRDIEGLRKKAAIMDLRARKNFDTKTFDAINFKDALEHNQPFIDMTDDGPNDYIKTYRSLVSELGSTNKDKADSIKFKFNRNKTGGENNIIGWVGRQLGIYDDDMAVNTFVKSLGLDLNKSNESRLIKQLDEYNVKYNPNINGYDEITIDKKNPLFHRFIKSAYNAGLGENDFKIIGLKDGKFIAEEGPMRFNAEEYANNEVNTPYINKSYHLDKFKQFFDEIDARSSVESTYDFQSNPDNQIVTGSIVSESIDARDAYARKMLMQGKMSPSEYESLREFYLDNDIKLLAQVNLEEYSETYGVAFDENEDSNVSSRNLRLLNNNEKQQYQNALQRAIKDNRINIAQMISGDKYGTVISILPEGNVKEPITPWNKNKTMQIFIPNLFQGEAETAFHMDSEFRAMQEVAEMNMYKYQKDLINGKYIKDVDNNGGYLYSSDGTSKTYKTTEQLQNIVKNNSMLEDLDENFKDELQADPVTGKIKDNNYINALQHLIVSCGITVDRDFGDTISDEDKETHLHNRIMTILKNNNFGEDRERFIQYYLNLLIDKNK